MTQIPITKPGSEGRLYVNEGFYDYYRVRDRMLVGSRSLRQLLRENGLCVGGFEATSWGKGEFSRQQFEPYSLRRDCYISYPSKEKPLLQTASSEYAIPPSTFETPLTLISPATNKKPPLPLDDEQTVRHLANHLRWSVRQGFRKNVHSSGSRMQVLGGGMVVNLGSESSVFYEFIAYVAVENRLLNIPYYRFFFDRELYEKMLGNLSQGEEHGWHRALDHSRDVELFTLELEDEGWRYMPNKRIKQSIQLLGTMALVRQMLGYGLVQICLVQ